MPLSGLPRRTFQAGRVHGVLAGADLCRLAVDGTETVRRIFVTVRDAEWGTLPIEALDVEIEEESNNGFRFRACATQGNTTDRVEWEATADLRGDGLIRYQVTAVPRTQFRFNRMGLCVLHPPESCTGQAFSAYDGSVVTHGTLPVLIGPQRLKDGQVFPLFGAFAELDIDVRRVGPCRFVFEGDLFEMEDQRNWSDGSFKSYCTPLSVPFPRTAYPGEAIRQSVRIRPLLPRQPKLEHEILIRLGPPLRAVVPEIGLCVSEPLGDRAASVIRDLAPGHLRVDLWGPSAYSMRLGQADNDAAAAGCDLVVAAHLGSALDDELQALAATLRRVRSRVSRVVTLLRDGPPAGSDLIRRAHQALAASVPSATFAGGTGGWFDELNRARPDARELGGLAWSVTPEVHTEDELSMIEALSAQIAQAATVRSFAGSIELLPGPITLRPAHGPPPTVPSPDPRQREPFGAAWTAGSIRAQSLAAVRAATYYQTIGPGGVLSDDSAQIYPCYKVLKAAASWRGWRVLASASSQPLTADALFVEDETNSIRRAGFVANYTDGTLAVEVTGVAGVERLVLDPWQVRVVTAEELAYS